MPDVSFSGLLIVSAVAFGAPLLLGLFPRIRLPAVVLEIVVGIAIGPSGLRWVTPDLPISILSVIGLAFLLFLAGLEVEVDRLRGRLLTLAGASFVLSFGLALVVGFAMKAAGQVRSPLLIAIVLVATSLGLVIPVLKDAGQLAGTFGQLVVAGSTIADFGAVIMLSLFFSGAASGLGTKLILLGGFVLVIAAIGLAVGGAARSIRLSAALLRLQDTTAQIRVRGAVLLLIGVVALAERFGLETILGAFMAGVVLRLVDQDRMMTHPNFRVKLEGIGYGFLVPVFFVTSGLRFDLHALFSSPSTVLRVPVFLAALLLVRGVPAALYRTEAGGPRRTVAAGLLQATSLPFIVAATAIGVGLGEIAPATAAALVAAGLLSVLLFPLIAITLLREREAGRRPVPVAGAEPGR